MPQKAEIGFFYKSLGFLSKSAFLRDEAESTVAKVGFLSYVGLQARFSQRKKPRAHHTQGVRDSVIGNKKKRAACNDLSRGLKRLFKS
jgi:hypothetical protein